MVEFSSYRRDFSELPGLQEAKTLCYILESRQSKGPTRYGIHVTETCQSGVICEKTHFFTCYRIQAEHLLTYLYENAVPAAQCISVISDACAAIKWEDKNDTSPSSIVNCG